MSKTASGVVAGLAALLLACSAPDAGNFTGSGAGAETGDDDDDDSLQGSSGISGTPGPSTGSTKTPAMSATLKGAGTGAITSTPSGLTCAGTTCTGNFAPGTAVTLTAKATAGSLFLGWGGGCTGAAACAVVVNGGPIAIDAEFALLAGSTWTGSYTGHKKVGGCVANNSGTITMRLAQSGGLLSSKVVLTGIDLRDTHSCHTAGTTGGLSADAPTTLTGQTLSGTWTVSATGPTSTFSYPFAATIVGKTMIGRWTCVDCVGEFSLTTP